MNDDFEKDKLDTRTVIDTALGMLCLLALLWLRGSFIIDARLAPGFSGGPVFALVKGQALPYMINCISVEWAQPPRQNARQLNRLKS